MCWTPQFKNKLKVLTCVQKKATKQVKGLEAMYYEAWLKALGLSSLEEKRQSCDLLALYSFMSREGRDGGGDLISLGSSYGT